MKLNYKKTILVGFAFFLISAFWQAYDAIVPLILTNHFGLKQSISGFVMSLDNILAVFMLPIFGGISDKVCSKYGKRTPFIFIGSIAAVIAFIALTFIDNAQLAKVIAAGVPAVEQGALSDEKYAELIRELTMEVTLANPMGIVGFIATLLVVLIAMATFRSPAVALMPDVTVKPLRSKGNAIINLMGTAGGIIVLVLGMIFGTSKNQFMQYSWYIVAVCCVMLLGLVIFILTVKENKWAKEMEEETKALNLEETVDENEPTEKRKLSKPEFKSLMLILASVALWYIGYNAITSKYSVYATNILGFDYNFTLILAQAAAVVAYIPVGIIASKFGRKKTILAGVAMLSLAFVCGIFLPYFDNVIITYPIFALAGIGWATINVNSFPMVVELAKGGDVGKYTGFYYTASMSAQIVTPFLSGLLIDNIGWGTFFPYAAIFVALAFVTMFFVKHGDSKPIAKKSVLENFDIDD
ncbi:MAG: MFS transporter [Clostridia bacterium]|nr:MFS transporter [Clostridia bacterium]